jgi:hypothetical protein
MTSSASCKNELLTERPSGLATLRLTASSNLFGDSAGKLPGPPREKVTTGKIKPGKPAPATVRNLAALFYESRLLFLTWHRQTELYRISALTILISE